MIELNIISTVVQRSLEGRPIPTGGNTIIVQGGGVNLSEYLKKQVWDTAWELRTTEEGESYIFCKLPFISQYGITQYADGGNIDLPSLYAGIPVDGTTITKREDGALMLNPNLELGGLDEEALQKYLDDYKYAKLSDIPSLDGYAKITDVDNRINDLINGAPQAYDTLKEIADVLQGNVNSIGDIITTLGNKADKTELDKYLPLKGGTINGNLIVEGNISIDSKKTIKIQGGYSILGLTDNVYFVGATNHPTNIKSDGTLTHNSATIWDSNTLTLLSQLTNDADFTTNAYVNETFVTLKGDPQTIESEKDFTGGLKVNGSPIVYDSEKGYWKLQGNLLITGGLTQYVDDGSVDLPNLYDGLPIDGTTIYWEETANGKVLKAKVAEGGITSITDTMIIEALGYTPYDATNPNGYITSAALNGYATQTWVSNNYLPLSGGTILGALAVKNSTASIELRNADASNRGFLSYVGGSTWKVSDNGWAHEYTLYHTGNLTSLKSPYALSWSGYSSGSYDGSAAKSITIPSNTNQLTNGAGFITSSGYSSGVLDYNNTASPIRIGYASTGLTASNALFLAAYGKDANNNTIIKDISKAEVQTWLGLGSNAYNSTAYLPLSGGTLSSASYANQLRINRTDAAGASVVRFSNSIDGILGDIGVGGSTSGIGVNPCFQDKSNNVYKIWHEGNSNLSSVDWNASKLILNTTNTTDWNVAIRTSAIQLLRTGGTAGNAPHTYCSGISIMTSYTGFQLASYGGDWNNLYFRSIRDNDTWLPWRTIAFTDSNVASATKLQTARKIWGQSFDGTGDVSGDLNNVGSIYFKANASYDIGGSGVQARYIYATYFGAGKNSPFKLGANDSLHMYISTSGNVGIGTTSPAYKLHISHSVGDMIKIQSSTTYACIIYEANAGSSWSVGGNSSNQFYFYNNGATRGYWDASGNLIATGGITQHSDIRKKTKLQDVELTLSQVANAPLIEHYYNSDDKKTTHVGSIAQYWAEMNDWFCKLDSDGFYTMEIQNAALASAISVARELERYESKTDKKIRLLKKRINELEDEIEKLKSA